MLRLLCSVLLITGVAVAQTPLHERPAVLPLSLKRAVEIALSPEGNTRVQLAEETIRQAESREAQARSPLLPNFDASLTEQNEVVNLQAFGIKFPSIPGLNFPEIAGPFNNFNARISGSQNIFDFSSIRRFQAARVTVEATKAEVEGTRNQVADQVARAYLTALRADADVATAQSNVELSEALLRLANSQKTAGTGTGIEIVRAQVQLANDHQQLLVAQTGRTRAHLQLLKTLGLRLDGDVELTDKLGYKPADNIPVDQAVKTALETRVELKAQQGHEGNARLSFSATKWERLPTLAFFGDYGTIGTGPNAAFPTRTYGVSLKVPLFDGGRRDARRSEALSEYKQEQVRTHDLRDQIELDIRVALDSVKSAEAQVAAAREGVELSEKELAQARRRYKAGVTNSIEVTDAQTRLQRARDNLTSALFNHNLARIDLSTAMGTIQALVDNF
ncbi:MAG: TolC family protein [Acidobacteriia bacterium]|nr:TolC family protein [Terriglobia bacterium]